MITLNELAATHKVECDDFELRKSTPVQFEGPGWYSLVGSHYRKGIYGTYSRIRITGGIGLSLL